MQTNNLKKIRKKRNIKVVDIIEYLDISHPYYYDLEKGLKRLNEDMLNKLASFYDVTTDYLLGRVDFENHIVLEGTALPPELQGIIEQVGILKGEGISEQDIKEILELHIRISKGKKK